MSERQGSRGGSAQGLGKSSSRRADQSLTEDFAGFREEDEFVAITGRGDTARTVLVENRPGYIYVRRPIRVVTGTLEEYSEAQAFTATEHRHGIPVTIRRSKDNPSRYEIAETWPIGLGEQLIETVTPQTTPHRVSHELFNASQSGGNDPVFIETLQVKNLQTTPTSPSGLNVHVRSGFYVQTNNEVAWYTGTLVNMTEFVPTGSFDVAFVSLWLDPVTDEIIKTNVTFTDSEANLSDPANYLRWPSDGSVPLATIRLTPGQTIITWADAGNPSIIDLRLSNTLPPGSSTTQGHALDPGGGFHTGTLDHGTGLTGLIDDDHTNYALLAGRASGQTLIGGIASGEDLTLESTADATKGAIVLNDAVKLKASSILTLSTGAITATGPYHIIAAETGTTDDLDTITASDDRTLLVIQADAGDTITVKDGTGNIQLNGGADFSLTGDATLLLFFDGTNWADVGAGGASGANTALSNLASVAVNTNIVPDTDDTHNLGTGTFRWDEIWSVSAFADAFAFTVKNTSGAAANANDVGFIDEAGEYKTTTTALDNVAWCVVISGAADNSDIYVTRRGRVTVAYTGSAPSTGDFLVTSTSAGDAQQQTTMRPEIFAVCLANGSGGTVEVLLLCHSRFVNAIQSGNSSYFNDAHSDWDFSSTIATLPGGAVLTYGSVTTGAENTIVPEATFHPYDYKLVLHNTTQGDDALIDDVDPATNTITLTAAVPGGWATTDVITVRSQTKTGQFFAISYWFDFDTNGFVPELTRAIVLNAEKNDSAAAGELFASAAFANIATDEGTDLFRNTSTTFTPYVFHIPLIEGRFVLTSWANGAGTGGSVIRQKGYWLATP